MRHRSNQPIVLGWIEKIRRGAERFHQLHGVKDSLLTKTHYSLAQMRLIEAAVLAVVNDDFTLAPVARRWLDDDEYLVRRRIHADVRAALSQAGM